MLVLTTGNIEGKKITKYLGIVTGEAILGADAFKENFGDIRDVVGGKSAEYERELRRARDIAIDEMCTSAQGKGGNAVIGVDIDYHVINVKEGHNMMMVCVSGTAVVQE